MQNTDMNKRNTTVDDITIGTKARDSVTGYEGIVIARTEWFNGSITYGVQGTGCETTKPDEPYWVDAVKLEPIENDGAAIGFATDEASSTTGGPTAKRNSDPK